MNGELRTPFRKILVVDDSQVAMALNCSLLKKIGGPSLEITSAFSYQEAIKLIAKQKFELYLVDYLLEDNFTGLDVLKEIRQIDSQVPVIILTGISERGKDIELLHNGASDYLEKNEVSVFQLERSLRFSWERKQFAEQIFKYESEKKSLIESIRSLEQVLSVVGHELRTPLAGVKLMAEYLREVEIEERGESSSGLESIISETGRLSSVVNNLVDLARLTSGNIEWSWGAVELSLALNDAITSASSLLKESEVELTSSIPPSLPSIVGDQAAIARLILNLLTNSINNTRAGKIHIEIAEEDGQIVIKVSDTGAGISPDTLKLLGEEFRLSASFTEGQYIPGSGFGISIVKGIAGAHGGTLKIISELNRGTLVTVYLKPDLATPAEGPCQVLTSSKLSTADIRR
jgi:signal transduction histidine kinase